MFPGKALVQITWLDACSDSARMHHDHETLSNYILPTMCNVGYVLHENESRLILSHGKGSTGEIDFFAIPLACITDRLVIRGEEEAEEAEVDEIHYIQITDPFPTEVTTIDSVDA